MAVSRALKPDFPDSVDGSTICHQVPAHRSIKTATCLLTLQREANGRTEI
jgi:hypothetical protein